MGGPDRQIAQIDVSILLIIGRPSERSAIHHKPHWQRWPGIPGKRTARLWPVAEDKRIGGGWRNQLLG